MNIIEFLDELLIYVIWENYTPIMVPRYLTHFSICMFINECKVYFWMSAFAEEVYGVKPNGKFFIIEAITQRVMYVTRCFADVGTSIKSR